MRNLLKYIIEEEMHLHTSMQKSKKNRFWCNNIEMYKKALNQCIDVFSSYDHEEQIIILTEEIENIDSCLIVPGVNISSLDSLNRQKMFLQDMLIPMQCCPILK
jgi:hypothetical protein